MKNAILTLVLAAAMFVLGAKVDNFIANKQVKNVPSNVDLLIENPSQLQGMHFTDNSVWLIGQPTLADDGTITMEAAQYNFTDTKHPVCVVHLHGNAQ